MSLEQLISIPSQSAVKPNDPPARRSLAWLLPAGLVLGFIAIIILLFGSRLLPAIEVTTAPVVTMRLSTDAVATPLLGTKRSQSIPSTMAFQASGWIEPDPYVTYVPVLINGVIDKVHILEGQSVQKGELIATLINDDALLEHKETALKVETLSARIKAHCVGAEIAYTEIDAAKKKIEALNASYEDSIDNLTRLEKLPLEAIPEQQVVQARLAKIRQQALMAEAEAIIPRLEAKIKQISLERETMTFTLAELEVDLEQAQLSLTRTSIYAPMDGMVLKLYVSPGKKRMLNMDDPDSAVVVSLYNPKKLQARIDVPLTEAAGIQLGQKVELTCDILPDTIFQGKVTRINGEADIQRNTLQAKVVIINPDPRFRPEMLVRGKFYTTSISGDIHSTGHSASNNRLALFVPEVSIINSDSVWVVSTTDTAELRKLNLGSDSREGYRRVLDGIKSGERVILPPHTQIEQGDRLWDITVTPSRESSAQ